jgi:hypothetical protein
MKTQETLKTNIIITQIISKKNQLDVIHLVKNILKMYFFRMSRKISSSFLVLWFNLLKTWIESFSGAKIFVNSIFFAPRTTYLSPLKSLSM